MGANPEMTTMDVVVHKANITLASGESLHSFTRKLSDAARAHASKKFLLNREKGDYTWPAELFSDSVVMSVEKDRQPCKLYAMKYERDAKSMEFKFGDPVEVERKTSFAPVNPTQMLTTKAEPKKVVKAVEQLDISKGERQVFGNEASQWVQTSKSFWGGIF